MTVGRLDSTAAAFVANNQVIRPVNFIYMDFAGDPVRVNDSGLNITVSGMGAPFDGTYISTTADFIELSEIRSGAGGSDTVTAKLSGIKTLDDTDLDNIGDETKWKGREVEVFRAVWNQANAQQGAFQHYYTGYMVDVLVGGDPENQFIEMSVENYLTAYVSPSNRTYLSQTDYDPNDKSGDYTIGLVNGAGNDGHPGTAVAGGGLGPGSLGMEPTFGFGFHQAYY